MGKKTFSKFLVFLFSFLPLLLLCSSEDFPFVLPNNKADHTKIHGFVDPFKKPLDALYNKVKTGSAETKGLFVFGSSLVDNGNNNFLMNASSRADYLPYGIDFPGGPTGRFSNGKNVIDLLGDLLKLSSSIPSFNDPSTNGYKILHGVNFASGGSGILDDTGSILGTAISLTKQLQNYQDIALPQLAHLLGHGSTDKLIISGTLSKYLFVIGAGGNDYLLNYFVRNSTRSASLEAFTETLAVTLSSIIKKLYQLGARKFVLMSIYPLGCIPTVKIKSKIRQGCISKINQAAILFNSRLKSLVDMIKPQLRDSNLVIVNSYKVTDDIIKDPIPRGFKDTSNACCELEKGGMEILCKRGGNTCEDRNSHVFFDGLHPTEALNKMIANIAYASNSSDEAHPINVRELAKL